MNYWINKKTKEKYFVTSMDAICKTDEYDGARLVVYTKDGNTYVRDYSEFLEKFEQQLHRITREVDISNEPIA